MKKYISNIIRTILVLISMLSVQIVDQGVSQAAVAELNYFQCHEFVENGRNWLRIELGMTGGKLEYQSNVRELRPNQLFLEMKNVQNKAIKSDIRLNKNIAKYLTIHNNGQKDLEVVVTLKDALSLHDYKVYLQEADHKLKKPFRMVIDIAEDKVQPIVVKPEPEESFPGLSGRHLVLDPGHGGSDTGAQGPHGLYEKNVTLAVALDMQKMLQNSGAVVRMTRNTDVDVYGPGATDKQELQARVDVAQAHSDTDIFVSVHCNAFTAASAHGTETYYYPHSDQDSNLANYIQTEMVRSTGLADRGISTARFYVLRNSAIPAVLVETAFISNYNEEKLLGDKKFQHKMAVAICRGISKYFSNGN